VNKILGLIVFLLISLPASAQQQPIRIKCGGPSYTDSKAQVWQADYGFNTGSAVSTGTVVSGTTDPILFETARLNNSSSTPLLYSVPVQNGNYHVNLYFAETRGSDETVGARVFNVKLQNSMVFPNLDIFGAAGADRALVEGVDIAVSNGKVTIEFDNVTQSAKVNAIEILPLAASSPSLSLNFMYPDGTSVSGTLGYTITSSLLTFQGSVPLTKGQATCNLLTSPSALGISTQFEVNLSLTDTGGHVLWQFTMGLNPAQINIAAVQSSALNVVVQKL
jgi:hypothetical protein